MSNPWHLQGGASALKPSPLTAGETPPPPLIPPDPPDLATPFSPQNYPPLGTSPPFTKNRKQSSSKDTVNPSSQPFTASTNAQSPITTSLATVSFGSIQYVERDSPINETESGITVEKPYFYIPPIKNSPLQTNRASMGASVPLPITPLSPPTPTLPSIPIPIPNPVAVHQNPSPVTQSLPVQNSQPQTSQPQTSQPQSRHSLVERLRLSESKTLTRLAPVSKAANGRPRILITDDVFKIGE
ncbi:leucine-rich repeat extensin-like protein 5 [Raphanus sativus]|uniref:Leucine-rich repeat extensin-like protein 5 n=1 Tax=Raphanus sativus TaxID=3726 RepID=A0A6J0LKE2_RAPSA|nr:leucine-rich repeat extensin-like protein 5 [Raphanus sativus]